MTEPLFACQDDGCAAEVSYPANMLAVLNDKPICQECYEQGDKYYADGDPDFGDLPKFVPEFQQTIDRLRAALDEIRMWSAGRVCDLRRIARTALEDTK